MIPRRSLGGEVKLLQPGNDNLSIVWLAGLFYYQPVALDRRDDLLDMGLATGLQ